MKTTGRYTPISNSVKINDIKDEYDVDHVINDVIEQINDIIEGADTGVFNSTNNYNLIVKAVINNLIDKL